MAGQASIENGRKGGRKVGSKATHTVQAEKAKALLIKMYLEKVKPINEALLKKAMDGDIQAIKELHDRVWGRPLQPVEAKVNGELKLTFDNSFHDPSKATS